MTTPLGVGVIGCGNISTAYMTYAPAFRGIEMRACADLDPAVAQAQAGAFGLRALGADELMADPGIDIVLNLTVPAAHFAVSRDALMAGKHVYSEKPFVLTAEEGIALRDLAEARGLRVGSAPDTFLGSAAQYARALVDAGRIGRITGGTAHMMQPGMEGWHPNPDFFFKPGGGPVLDMGPYYLAHLVHLLGPAARVTALAATPAPERVIGSGPRAGARIAVETPTTLHSVIAFASGALVTFGASWDVQAHGHAPLELYGTDGTLTLPDPNFFAGEVRLTRFGGGAETGPDRPHPFGAINHESAGVPVANHRTAGLADMAQAIAEGRPHRCSLELAAHCIEIMNAILASSREGRAVALGTTCERPEPLPPEAAAALLA